MTHQLSLSLSFPQFTFTNQPPKTHFLSSVSRNNASFRSKFRCMSSQSVASENIVRRSGNYQPPIWNYDFVQSLNSKFKDEIYVKRISKLKEEVRDMVNNPLMNNLDKLELIDVLQRLGLDYHFEDEIQTQLMSINNSKTTTENLHAVALKFRLMRQHGYHISQDVFNDFQDEKGNFKTCISENLEGMLSLYEASYLSEEGENVLEVARIFTTTYLKSYIEKNNNNDDYLSMMISHAMEMPLHWRMLRLEARWFIDVYEIKSGMNSILLELAKLDFNFVQAIHQEDLKYASRWWMNTGLGEKLDFARNRIVENFSWSIGMMFQPQFSYCRRMLAKATTLVATIDDIYDIYGTLDELEKFTDAVERWDVMAIERLPDYMKTCFLMLYNTVNEMGFDALKEQGYNIIPHLHKSWADVCKAYMLEARWYNSGSIPTFEEYINNGWISICTPVMLVHSYFLSKNPLKIDALKALNEYPNIIRWSSTILRYVDDLATSSDELKRGDVLKSVQNYMHHTGVSEERAREHIEYLIRETWKKLNKERAISSPFSKTYIDMSFNLARFGHYIYYHGDNQGTGIETLENKERVSSLLVQPISCILNS